MEYKTKHISLTGAGAGRTACDRKLSAIRFDGHISAHLPYSGNLEDWVTDNINCLACLDAWIETSD